MIERVVISEVRVLELVDPQDDQTHVVIGAAAKSLLPDISPGHNRRRPAKGTRRVR